MQLALELFVLAYGAVLALVFAAGVRAGAA